MRELEIRIPSDRLIGFTIPQAGRFLVCDHDEVWQVAVSEELTVEETDHAPYEIAKQSDFVGWGKPDIAPILMVEQMAVSYNFNPRARAVKVFLTDGVTREQIDFPIFSGDWFNASLSREGELLVLAEPYKISVYRTK